MAQNRGQIPIRGSNCDRGWEIGGTVRACSIPMLVRAKRIARGGRENNKKARVIAMIRWAQGAAQAEIMEATS